MRACDLVRRVGTSLTAAITILAASPPALGWGDEGHRIAAIVAYAHLTEAARKVVDGMLASDGDTLTDPDFASRATWADKWRDSDRNTTRERYLATRAWHFVDVELDAPDVDAACFGHPAAAEPASSGPSMSCVVDRIGAFAAELADPTTAADERLLALKFLLHLIGDVHQPLHAADNHDKGGNDVLVLWGHHRVGVTLHGFWDTQAVKMLGGDPVRVASDLEARFGAGCDAWMAGTPRDWALEAFGVARASVYQLPDSTTDAHGSAAFVLSGEYQRAASEVAGEQLERAGCRLAMVLNTVLTR